MHVPPPPSRTKWTRRVPHPVLIGHAASLTPSDLKGEGAGHYLFEAARRGVWVAFVEPVVRLSTSDAPHQHQTPTPDDVILSQQRVRLSLIAAACSIISHRSSVFDYLSSQQRVRLSLIAAACSIISHRSSALYEGRGWLRGRLRGGVTSRISRSASTMWCMRYSRNRSSRVIGGTTYLPFPCIASLSHSPCQNTRCIFTGKDQMHVHHDNNRRIRTAVPLATASGDARVRLVRGEGRSVST